MKRSARSSPRSEPDRIYKEFCALMKRQLGQLLNLPTLVHFNAVVNQFYVVPRRFEHWDKLIPVFWAWHQRIEQKTIKEAGYVKRKRTSLTDNLWTLLGRLYWSHAAWIVLRGEYKALRKTLPDDEIRERLENVYSYLPQVQTKSWFHEMKHCPPMESAYQDLAGQLGLDDRESLRVMLSPDRLRKSPPTSLLAVNMNSKTLLKKLQRISPSRRTPKDWALIRAIKAEV